MANIVVNQGTQTAVATDTVGTIEYQKIKLDVGATGASSPFTGTLAAVTNLAGGTVTAVNNLVKGTVTRVEGGTIQTNQLTGTINVGTFVNNGGTVISDNYTFRHGDEFSTVVSSGTSTLGTIKAAVAGSAIYVTDIIMSVGTPTNVTIASGGTSTPIIGSIQLNTYGGLVSNFRIPIRTASGSALVYQQSANGPLTITCNGYVD
jgi:hypothetical protein